MPIVELLDSFMNYNDTEHGDGPVVFLHGNPTSSYIWRSVIPHVARQYRCLAPDLIGMGASGKPESAYRFADHARYLDAWFDAVAVDEAVLVGHDWGGALAMDWAVRHPARVRGIAVIETFLRPMQSEELAPPVVDVFRGYRSGKGEEMVLERNMVIEANLVNGVMSGLAESDLDVYRAPFIEPASRLPMLEWTREFPLDGDPADVVDVINGYGEWMASSSTLPKLVMAVENGVGLGSPEVIAWADRTFANVEVRVIGPGGHQIPEDQPDTIGAAVADWLARKLPTASKSSAA